MPRPVLVDQPAETIATTHGAVHLRIGHRGLPNRQGDTTVRPVPVVVTQVLSQDPLQMALAKDQGG